MGYTLEKIYFFQDTAYMCFTIWIYTSRIRMHNNKIWCCSRKKHNCVESNKYASSFPLSQPIWTYQCKCEHSHSHFLLLVQGQAVTQVVGTGSLNVEAWVWSQAIPCVIYGEKSGNGIGFTLSAVVPCSVLEFGGTDHSMFEKTA